jgi:hypothetical protein
LSNAMTALATITLGSAQATVTFGSIPATYRDLRLVVVAATSANSNNIFRLNGDSGNNYTGVYATGNGTSATSGPEGGTFMNLDSSAFTTTTVGDTNHLWEILDYSATDKHKSMLGRTNRAAGAVDMHAGRWASTAAVTSITLLPYTGGYTWLAGSTFLLFGILA